MSKQVVSTTQAPGASGPYSQGIVANGFMFVAGQIAVVPGTKDFVAGGIKEQTAQVLNNLKAILEAGGKQSDPLIALVTALEIEGPTVRIIDMLEDGLDAATQEAHEVQRGLVRPMKVFQEDQSQRVRWRDLLEQTGKQLLTRPVVILDITTLL